MSQSTSMPVANRRSFLKLAALGTSLLVTAPLTFAINEQFSSLKLSEKIYRGTSDGRIFVSKNNGVSWQQVVNFGKNYHVDKIVADKSGVVRARLKNKNLSFWIHAKNDLFWVSE